MLRHFGIALTSLTILSGCTGTGGGFALPKSAPEQIRVANQEVLIAGPKGFCVDPTETRDTGDSAFVLLGSCAAIANSRNKPHPKVPAILTATVSRKSTNPPITSSMPALTDFFTTKAGRAALSRDGNADTVEVVKTLDRDGVFYIRARDSSSDTLAGAADEYWRALFDVNGRIVSASVFGLRENPIPSEKGFDVLQGFTKRIRTQNTAEPDQVAVENKPRVPFFKRVFKRKPE